MLDLEAVIGELMLELGLQNPPGVGLEHTLRSLGWESFSFGWIKNSELAIYCVVIAAVWQTTGFVMAMFLAGLRGVDTEQINAARVDGAKTWQIYQRVIIPQLGPVFVSAFVILAHMAISLPLNIWLMWQYFQIVPLSLEEAAWTSGASRLAALRQVCLPSARPGILSVAIFSFALSWNDFTFAFILQTDRKMFTLPVGLASFVEQTGVHWGMVMAAAVLVSVPTFLLVFFLQRYLLSGLRTAG